ncbi:MAG: histidine kinase [Bacteroidota bacterium]
MDIQKAITLAEKIEYNKLEEVLISFATSVIPKSTEEEVLWDLTKNCISGLGIDDCVVYKADYEKKVLVQKAAHGPKNPEEYRILEPINIKFGEGITGNVVETGFPELIRDTSKDPRYIVDDQARLSEIAVPIVIKRKVWGVIDCEHPDKDYFNKQHLRILKAIASICAVKLERVAADIELKEKRDALIAKEHELLNLRVTALRRQINPHFLFNAINAIQHFLTTKNHKEALRYQALFSKLLRDYLKHMDLEELSLADELRMISWYLELQQLRYENRLKFEIRVEERLTSKHIPSLLLQLVAEDMVESLVMNENDSGILLITFDGSPESITSSFELKVNGHIKSSRLKDDDYRSELFNWTDHVDSLNRLKEFQITYKVTEKDEVTNGQSLRSVILHIPILNNK